MWRIRYIMYFSYETFSRGIMWISIYTLSDLGVLSNLIGSLSLANEHYNPPINFRAISLATLRHVLDSYHAITPV